MMWYNCKVKYVKHGNGNQHRYFQTTPMKQTSGCILKLKRYTTIFEKVRTLENVGCIIAFTLCRPQCAKPALARCGQVRVNALRSRHTHESVCWVTRHPAPSTGRTKNDLLSAWLFEEHAITTSNKIKKLSCYQVH